MQIHKITTYNPAMGIRKTPTRYTFYDKNCYITDEFGRFKDYKIIITRNYINNKLSQTLMYITDKRDNWIMSKLKTFKNGEKTVIRSENNVCKLDRKKDC